MQAVSDWDIKLIVTGATCDCDVMCCEYTSSLSIHYPGHL